VISKHRFLRAETRDYVPKIIAAALIAKNRVQFGFPEAAVKPEKDEAVAGDGMLVKVEKSDRPEEKVEVKPGDTTEKVDDLLTALAKSKGDGDIDQIDDDEEDSESATTTSGKPVVTPATLLVMSDRANSDGSANGDKDGQPLARPVPTPHLTKDGVVGGMELVEFDVKGPADLLKVARAAGLSYQSIKSLNPELLRWCTPPSVGYYRLHLPANVKDKFLATYNHTSYPRQVKFMVYKVRRGETLAGIARHFGIKVDPIADLNGVSPRMPMRKNIQILLPIPDDRSRSLASLDVRDPPEKAGSHHRHHRARYYKISYKERQEARHF
jgi:LysM repeat protein